MQITKKQSMKRRLKWYVMGTGDWSEWWKFLDMEFSKTTLTVSYHFKPNSDFIVLRFIPTKKTFLDIYRDIYNQRLSDVSELSLDDFLECLGGFVRTGSATEDRIFYHAHSFVFKLEPDLRGDQQARFGKFWQFFAEILLFFCHMYKTVTKAYRLCPWKTERTQEIADGSFDPFTKYETTTVHHNQGVGSPLCRVLQKSPADWTRGNNLQHRQRRSADLNQRKVSHLGIQLQYHASPGSATPKSSYSNQFHGSSTNWWRGRNRRCSFKWGRIPGS